MEDFIVQINSLIPGFMENMFAGLVIFSRMLGFARFAPVLNRKEIPGMVKIGLSFLLSIIFVMLLHPKGMPENGDLLLAIILNLAVGAMIGYMAQLILAAVEAGGDMINMQQGVSSANIMDRTTSAQVSIMGRLFSMFGLIIFLEIGGAYWTFNAFIRSFEIFPMWAMTLTRLSLWHWCCNSCTSTAQLPPNLVE